MNKPNESSAPVADRMRWFVVATGALALGFSMPLYHLIRLAADSDLYSYIILIPFISGYLVWTKRTTLPPPPAPAHSWTSSLLLVAAAGVLAVYWIILLSGTKLAPEDSLALTTISLVLFFWGICGYFLGRETVRALAFPLVFLVFMVPFPICLRTSLETALQYGSADAAHAFFTISGMPFLRDNVAFHLPGFSLQVAPECSGIRSTLALFITSLLAGHLYLRSPWKRAVLTVSVILIALLRNGFRVFVIGQLCVHIGPEMIDSPIHRHGGPVFFALSLIPFGVLLLWLVHLERRAVRPGEKK